MSTWTKRKLGDVLEKIIGGGTPSKSKPEYWNGGLPWASVKDLYDNKYYLDATEDYISEEGLNNSASNFIKKGTVILPTRMGLGRVVKTKIDTAINQDLKALIPNDKINNDFLLWSLVYSGKKLQNIGNGSTVSGIRLEDLRGLEIDLPDLTTQTCIASVLSAYDDLIENNEKRIKILEEMAERLYREWFVKFKFPGHEKVRLIDSGTEYGKIPEGWKIVPMSVLADFINGYPFKPRDLGEHGLPIIKIPELRSGVLDKTPRNSGTSIPKKYSVKGGDIVFSWSATLLVNIWNSGDGLLNQHLFKVTPKQKFFRSYVFYALTKLVEKLGKHVVGATMQHLRRDTIVEAKMILPTKEVLEAYEQIASRLLEQISFLYKKNQNLIKTRDLLIPQLVTGKREIKI